LGCCDFVVDFGDVDVVWVVLSVVVIFDGVGFCGEYCVGCGVVVVVEDV